MCASAVGYYGIHPASQVLDESSAKGNDFLADLCDEWEKAALPAARAGVRVVHLRFGVVLSAKGGALAKMLVPFRLGLGGPIGCGTQIMSWIALEEIPPIMNHVIKSDRIAGAVNAVSPQPVSNAQFSKTLGKALRRPAFMPLPSFMVKILFGEMGTALLLGGQNVVPKVLLESGYRFQRASLEEALREIL